MILGVGTDICQISRIAKAIENPRFAARVFTDLEWRRLDDLCGERVAERAAGMFAAKEAVAKALGTGFRGFGMQDVEILADERGRPVAMLHNGAAARAGGGRVHISISHDGGMALAFAVWEAKEAEGCAT